MRLRVPDALTFLFLCLWIAAAFTWIVPPGEYQRRDDPVTHRTVVVAGTYRSVARAPVGPFAALVAIPRGFTDAAAVIGFVLLVGAGIAVVDRTGAFADGVDHLIASLGDRSHFVLPIVGLLFALGGIAEGMMEEIIPLVPVLLLVARRLGYRPVVAVSIGFGMAVVGGAFSPMNPFQVGIAQRLAGVPILSAWPLRVAALVPALAVALWWTMRQSAGHREQPSRDAAHRLRRLSGRAATVLVLVLIAIVVYVVGVLEFDWGFEQMAAIFLVLGIVSGLIGGLRVSGTVDALVDGFRGMIYAGMVIGLARAVYLVLQDGHIIDSLVRALFVPVSALPAMAAAIGMMFAHTLLHVPVPSTTGQAVLSMPILVPLSDLLGLGPQVTVLAYQYGTGLCEMLTPTNGAMMAVLAAAGVRYEDWLRFALPLWAMLIGLGAIVIMIAVAIPAWAG
jgi:uncharacterized ion transporter superfamily protein YfcC